MASYNDVTITVSAGEINGVPIVRLTAIVPPDDVVISLSPQAAREMAAALLAAVDEIEGKERSE